MQASQGRLVSFKSSQKKEIRVKETRAEKLLALKCVATRDTVKLTFNVIFHLTFGGKIRL